MLKCEHVEESDRRSESSEVRASAGRIVDMLQRLVLLRPDMVIPLEDVIREVLTNPRLRLITPPQEPADHLRAPPDKPKRREGPSS